MRALAALLLLALVGCATEVTGPSPAPTRAEDATPLFGDWRWTRSCEAVVDAFREAGMAGRIREALVAARYYPHEDRIPRTNPCAGAEETDYLYFFEAPGRWGVVDDDDVLVEDREFRVVDADTIAFDEVEVTYRIDGDGRLTFEVRPATPCDGACEESYAWALATFAAATLRRDP
jgi:hypothetical protein